MTYRTILPWIAQETQYWSLRYILGTEYSAKTEASEMSPVCISCQSTKSIFPLSFHSHPPPSLLSWRKILGWDSRVDVRMAADSTMLRMVNLLMALSLGVHREQLEQRTGLTWPLPFLLRPL